MRSPHVVPPPDSRVSVRLYTELRAWMIDNDPDAAEILQWSADITPHETAEDLAGDIIWIILCAGRSAQAARTIERKVLSSIRAGTPVVDVFGYRAKAAAIDRAWAEREKDFVNYIAASTSGQVNDLLAWCRSIPFIGDHPVPAREEQRCRSVQARYLAVPPDRLRGRAAAKRTSALRRMHGAVSTAGPGNRRSRRGRRLAALARVQQRCAARRQVRRRGDLRQEADHGCPNPVGHTT